MQDIKPLNIPDVFIFEYGGVTIAHHYMCTLHPQNVHPFNIVEQPLYPVASLSHKPCHSTAYNHPSTLPCHLPLPRGYSTRNCAPAPTPLPSPNRTPHAYPPGRAVFSLFPVALARGPRPGIKSGHRARHCTLPSFQRDQLCPKVSRTIDSTWLASPVQCIS